MLKLASDNLNRAVDELQNKLFEQTSTEKNIFKTREVYDILRRQFFGLKKEYERTLDKKFDLQHKIISPQRATDMAKNIFVRGGLKKIRADFRKLKKKTKKIFLKIFSPLTLVKNFSEIVIGLLISTLFSYQTKKLCSNLNKSALKV